MLQYLVIVGAIVQLSGISFYIVKILKGKIKPNRVSWLLWSVTPIIGSIAMIADGVRWAVLPVFIAGFGPLLVFFSSFANKNSYWKLEKFDYFCGFLSVLALILWAITKQPVIAIVTSIAGDAFAAVPTLVKAWHHPETESAVPYATDLFNVSTSFVAIKTWNFSSFGFPVYLFIINGLLLIFSLNHKIFKSRVKLSRT